MWKELLAELEALTEASGRNAHRVAEICRDFLKDRKWIDDVHKGVRDNAEKELSRFSNRMALSLDSLLCMIDEFPNVADWDGADLEGLRWQAAVALNAKRRPARHPIPIVSPVIGAPKAVNWPANTTVGKAAPRQPEPPEFPAEPARQSTKETRVVQTLRENISAERETVASLRKENKRLLKIIAEQEKEIRRLTRQLGKAN